MSNEKRLIDAKVLMTNGWHLVKTGKSNRFLASMSLADVPTVDAVEVVHGRWDKRKDDELVGYDTRGNIQCRNVHSYYCTKCGQNASVKSNYCPNCGAKMRGSEE